MMNLLSTDDRYHHHLGTMPQSSMYASLPDSVLAAAAAVAAAVVAGDGEPVETCCSTTGSKYNTKEVEQLLLVISNGVSWFCSGGVEGGGGVLCNRKGGRLMHSCWLACVPSIRASRLYT
jgi:hypothetical protein